MNQALHLSHQCQRLARQVMVGSAQEVAHVLLLPAEQGIQCAIDSHQQQSQLAGLAVHPQALGLPAADGAAIDADDAGQFELRQPQLLARGQDGLGQDSIGAGTFLDESAHDDLLMCVYNKLSLFC